MYWKGSGNGPSRNQKWSPDRTLPHGGPKQGLHVHACHVPAAKRTQLPTELELGRPSERPRNSFGFWGVKSGASDAQRFMAIFDVNVSITYQHCRDHHQSIIGALVHDAKNQMAFDSSVWAQRLPIAAITKHPLLVLFLRFEARRKSQALRKNKAPPCPIVLYFPMGELRGFLLFFRGLLRGSVLFTAVSAWAPAGLLVGSCVFSMYFAWPACCGNMFFL